MSTPLQRCIDLVQNEPPEIDFIILGEPASKANSRRMARMKRKGGGFRIGSIKSDKALSYSDGFVAQVPRLFPCLTGTLFAAIHIAYATERPDLDESLILDLMQVRVINNDRQIRHRFVTHSIDRDNPRCRVRLWRFT